MAETNENRAIREGALAVLGEGNLILSGFMGTGKSTVGRILAQELDWKLVDTDGLIEKKAGMTIPEIFDKQGEGAFRAMEREVAKGLAELRNCVISTGGGFIVSPENREAAERAGVLVLLMATPEQIWHRVKDSGHRPLLDTEDSKDPESKIRELLEQRRAAYEAVPIKIDTNAKTPTTISSDVLGAIAGL